MGSFLNPCRAGGCLPDHTPPIFKFQAHYDHPSSSYVSPTIDCPRRRSHPHPLLPPTAAPYHAIRPYGATSPPSPSTGQYPLPRVSGKLYAKWLHTKHLSSFAHDTSPPRNLHTSCSGTITTPSQACRPHLKVNWPSSGVISVGFSLLGVRHSQG